MRLQLSVAKIVVCSSEKCLVVMESNVTMFEETIYNVTYPLYATYMKLFGFLFMAVLQVISSSYVIHVILKNKELRNTNNMLIINLLITDIICAIHAPYDLSMGHLHHSFSLHNELAVCFVKWGISGEQLQ